MLNSLQQKLLEAMAWFHDFCVENNLRYYAIGGTMLGAMRHEGFIPWDDDIDIGMPREDYNKLQKIFYDGGGRYILETPNSKSADYYYPFSKIYDTTTTLIENTRYKIKRGIYIDIFPLDGIGNSYEESVSNYRSIHWKYNLLLTRAGGIRSGRSALKNLAVCISRLIPNVVLDNKKLLKSLDESCAKLDFDKMIWGGNLVGAWRLKEVMPTYIVGTPQIYKFETLFIYGVEFPDEYLTRLYGNWHELPPTEKRKSHHDYLLCDLNTSYLVKEDGRA